MEADFREFGGIRAPSRGEVWRDTPEGRLVYVAHTPWVAHLLPRSSWSGGATWEFPGVELGISAIRVPSSGAYVSADYPLSEVSEA